MSKINIQVSRDTHRKLDEEGRRNETFDQIVSRAVNALQNEKLYHSFYVPVRVQDSMNLQYMEIRMCKNTHQKIHIEDLLDTMFAVAEENGITLEIKGSYEGQPDLQEP